MTTRNLIYFSITTLFTCFANSVWFFEKIPLAIFIAGVGIALTAASGVYVASVFHDALASSARGPLLFKSFLIAMVTALVAIIGQSMALGLAYSTGLGATLGYDETLVLLVIPIVSAFVLALLLPFAFMLSVHLVKHRERSAFAP